MLDHHKISPQVMLSRTSSSVLPEKAKIIAGNKSIYATVLSKLQPSNYTIDYITMNNTAARKLLLPSNVQLKYQILLSNPLTIQVGPLIGVLTSVPRSGKSGLPIGKEAHIFMDMFKYGRKHGAFMFLFYAPELDWSKGTIKGYTIAINNKNIRWISGVFPIPDIIYNRIRYRHIELSPVVHSTLAKCEQHSNVKIFNTRFLDKWEVYEVLDSDPNISHLMPPSMVYNKKNLNIFLQNYPEFFIKPISSSMGKGIIKIIRSPDGSYIYKISKNGNLITECASGSDLHIKLAKYLEKEKQYLIQKGIDLSRINDCVFDMRTLTQKDSQGRWTLIGIGVRVAAKDNFLTHIPNGGKSAKYDEIISKVFGEKSKQSINKQINNIIKYVPKVLEKQLGLNLAILSIDIAADSAGMLWIIEVNSKPSSFDEPEIHLRSLQHFIDYCGFIAGKSEEDIIC